MKYQMIIFHVLIVACFPSSLGSILSPSRLCVIENRLGGQGHGGASENQRMLAFRCDLEATPVSVLVSYIDADGSSTLTGWSMWKTLGAPSADGPLSNPTCVYTEHNQTQIFVQAEDGQVYTSIQDTKDFLNFSTWKKVGFSSIPANNPKQSVLVDSVSVVWYGKELMVFARSISSSASQLYWCKGSLTNCKWELVAGSAILGTDATIIENTYTNRYEAFMISHTGKMHRSWQHASGKSFAAWKAMRSSPTFSTMSRPVAQIMGYNICNGKIMIGGIGKDNFVHRCAQATCDTVDNPWSYCTWGQWHQIGGKIPFAPGGVQNNLVMSRTVHYGMEFFRVQETNGQLWQTWQPSRNTGWNAWRKIEETMATFINNPFIYLNDAGWWMAYGLNAQNQVFVLEASRSMTASPNPVSWSKSLVVSWSVTLDEASNKDWIGIFLPGAKNDQYLDYRYVQGGLNPGSRPVSVGKLSMTPFLPNGSYQVCYLVNRKFISVMETDVNFYNESHESDLRQLFRGLYMGLGIPTDYVSKCVDDTQETVKLFQDCFHAFKTGKVYSGLQLLGTALQDLALTLIRCRMTMIVQPLLKFIEDLLHCLAMNCLKFVIDFTEMLIILFQNRYEIYGDIRSAANSFQLAGAHQQGGLCIGRMVKACLGIEDSLLSNGSMQIIEINGTLGRQMIPYETGRKGVFELVDTGKEEGAKLIYIAKRETSKVLDAGRKEGEMLIDSARKEGMKLIDASKKVGRNIINTTREEGMKVIDSTIKVGQNLINTTREEGMKLIDASKKVGRNFINTTREEGMKLIDSSKKVGQNLIDTTREEGMKLIDTSKKVGQSVVSTARKEGMNLIDTVKKMWQG